MLNNDKKTIKQKILLWRNSLRFHITMQRKGRFFQVVLLEKYKKIIKFLKIIFTLIGLFSAFILFKSTFVAFIFASLIYFIGFFLEKVIFAYTSLYVHLIPEFEYHSEKWMGAFFGYGEDPNTLVQFPLVGWMFSDEGYARKIHSLLLAWSCNKYNDRSKNICMSVILDNQKDENGYVFFCYPNVERGTAKKFFEEIEKERKTMSLTDVHYRFSMMLILGKRFKLLESSYLPTFRRRYQQDVPFVFQIAVANGNMQPGHIGSLKDFVFYDLKIKNKEELNRKDIEFDLLRILG